MKIIQHFLNKLIFLQLFAVVSPCSVIAQTLLVSTDSIATIANGISDAPVVSSESDLIAFSSTADNLVTGDTNNVSDIFVHYQNTIQPTFNPNGTRETTRVSIANDSAQANGRSHSPSLSSASGRFVAFVSAASNLVTGDTNNKEDIFIRDRSLNTTYRVSMPHDIFGVPSGEANDNSFSPHISSDGCYVVFASDASNLNPLNANGALITDSNDKRDVFLYYNPRGENGCSGGEPYLELVSITPSGAAGNDDSSAPWFSSVRFISFTSKASDLVSNDNNGFADIFVRDRALTLNGQSVDRLTIRVSIPDSGESSNGDSYTSQMDSSVVVFDSVATNLVADDSNQKRDVFMASLSNSDRSKSTTTLISKTIAGALGNGDSFAPSISRGANYVAFSSDATNLSAGLDCNQATDIFVRDFILSTLRRVNLTTAGYQSESGLSSNAPSIAGGGLAVVYRTQAKLNTSDDNGIEDIYLSVASSDPNATEKPLLNKQKLDEQPDVCIDRKKAQVVLERFSSVSTSSISGLPRNQASSYPCSGSGLCYMVNANPVKNNGATDRTRNRIELVKKRNSITTPRLKPGNYAVSFRVFGKSGRKVIKSSKSPSRIITVSK